MKDLQYERAVVNYTLPPHTTITPENPPLINKPDNQFYGSALTSAPSQ